MSGKSEEKSGNFSQLDQWQPCICRLLFLIKLKNLGSTKHKKSFKMFFVFIE